MSTWTLTNDEHYAALIEALRTLAKTRPRLRVVVTVTASADRFALPDEAREWVRVACRTGGLKEHWHRVSSRGHTIRLRFSDVVQRVRDAHEHEVPLLASDEWSRALAHVVRAEGLTLERDGGSVWLVITDEAFLNFTVQKP